MGEVKDLKKQVQVLSEKIIILENIFQSKQKDIIKEALAEFTSQKKDSLKSEFLRKFNKNKKVLIKQKIIESLKTKPMFISDLKYYLVDQLNYCSKASFYRYMQEMEDDIEIKNETAYLKTQIQV